MNVLHSIEELDGVPGPVFLAIGVFDGIHLGHRAVIDRALADARAAGGTAVVVTFDPHPVRVLRPEKAPRLLTSSPHKVRLLEKLGVTHVLVIRFDRELAATPPRDFILGLHRHCNDLREICVGHTWSFGKDRAGNLGMLRALGDEVGFDEVGIPAVEVDGILVSSTLIRSAVEAGDLDRAARFLGREYTILGTVIEGDHLGRTLGFPTANLAAHNEQFPPNGVYAVEVGLDGGRRPAVANIGVRPTVHTDPNARLLELHLLDFSGDLYGQDLEVYFRGFLRPELKFTGLEALKDQIARDAAAARAILAR